MKDKKVLIFLFTALLLRLAIAPFYHHSDADTIFYWGKYLWETKGFFGFLGKGVPNAMPAVYPPLFYYLLFVWRGFYFLVKEVLWFLNVRIGLFPSGVVAWFESYEAAVGFNKLMGIAADFGCAGVIYKISLLVSGNKKNSIVSGLFFLLFPVSWYLSAYWGQVDSIWGFFILLSVYLLLKNNFFFAVFSAGISLLFKQTGLLVFPLILFFCFRQKKFFSAAAALLVLVLFVFVAYLPFFPDNTLPSAAGIYLKSFRGEIDYLVANAFNLWALFFGFEPKSDRVLFLGFPAFWWGYFLFALTGFLIFRRLWNNLTKTNFLAGVFLFSQGAFLFLPRMHERYFYLAYLFLPVLMVIREKTKICYVILSMIFLLNLYHYWWYPKVPLLVNFLLNGLAIRVIITINIAIFVRLLAVFLKNEYLDNNRQF